MNTFLANLLTFGYNFAAAVIFLIAFVSLIWWAIGYGSDYACRAIASYRSHTWAAFKDFVRVACSILLMIIGFGYPFFAESISQQTILVSKDGVVNQSDWPRIVWQKTMNQHAATGYILEHNGPWSMSRHELFLRRGAERIHNLNFTITVSPVKDIPARIRFADAFTGRNQRAIFSPNNNYNQVRIAVEAYTLSELNKLVEREQQKFSELFDPSNQGQQDMVQSIIEQHLNPVLQAKGLVVTRVRFSLG